MEEIIKTVVKCKESQTLTNQMVVYAFCADLIYDHSVSAFKGMHSTCKLGIILVFEKWTHCY